MKIYHYHRETGAFLSEAEAAPDPLEHELVRKSAYDAIAAPALETFASLPVGADLLEANLSLAEAVGLAQAAADAAEPQHWLVPAFATTEAPPEALDGHQAVFRDGAWAVEPIPADETAAEPSDAERWAHFQHRARYWHDQSDKALMLFFEHGQTAPTEWIAYRRALRAIMVAETGDPDQALPETPELPTELVVPA